MLKEYWRKAVRILIACLPRQIDLIMSASRGVMAGCCYMAGLLVPPLSGVANALAYGFVLLATIRLISQTEGTIQKHVAGFVTKRLPWKPPVAEKKPQHLEP